MNTERIDIVSGDREKGIRRAGEILKQGGIVAIPTETVYGLAASAFDDEAIKKVFIAKGRPQNNPLIVHISDMDMIISVAEDIPELAIKLAEEFWPGPFTMVLKKKNTIADRISAGLDTVAVRMPSSNAARDIIRSSGLPLAAPSANISGAPSPTTALHALSDLDGKVDAVVLGEDCTVGVESTVLALFTDPPRLLRPGAVTAEELYRFIPDLVIDRAILFEPEIGKTVASPGMLYRHYAPKTQTFLVNCTDEQFVKLVNSKENCAAICFSDEAADISGKKIVYGDKDDKESLAHNLFSALRDVDSLRAECVYVHAPNKAGIGLAIYNRLLRAAAFKVINL
ncbi:MAG: threonylcarbamoyl-AMP synthase [Clostridia bacterium]|nr:threonylcarbamoyl-AMP synthase [Clostridia bacterium]